MAIRSKDPKYIAVMAISSVFILAVGALIRPQPENADTVSIRTPSEIVRLERLTQRRSVEDFAEYFAYAAGLVEDSVLLLGASGRTGLIWESDSVLTAAGREPFPAVDRTVLGGDALDLAAAIAGPHLPYVLLRTPVDALPSPRVPARLYAPGSWLVAVWRTPEGSMRYAAGHLLGIAERSCSGIDVTEVLTNFNASMLNPGSGLFDLDGNLVAVALACEGETIAVDADALAAAVRPDDSLEARLVKRYGMRVDTAARSEAAYFQRPGGVIVREMWSDYGAYRAGLLPGDFILSIDGQGVATVADLERLTLPVSAEMFELDIWRAGRRLQLPLPARHAPAAASSPHGFVGREDGLPIVRTDNGSLAARVGARAGDRLIAVNQTRPQSFADVDRAFRQAQGRPVHLVFERHGRLWGAQAEQP